MIEVARPGPGDDAVAFGRNGADIPITYAWAERLKPDPFEAYYHPLDHATVGQPIRTRLVNSMTKQFVQSFESRHSHAGRRPTIDNINRGYRMLEADDWQAAANLAYRAALTGQSSTDQRAINLLLAIQSRVKEYDRFAPALQPIVAELYEASEPVAVRASFTWSEFSGVKPDTGRLIGGRQILWEPHNVHPTPTPKNESSWAPRNSQLDILRRDILYSRPVRFLRRNALAVIRRIL